jgi:uncharacterized protein DUF3489
MSKGFSSRSNAKRAALVALGANAAEGADYTVTQAADGRWQWVRPTKPTEDSHGAISEASSHPRAKAETRASESGKGGAGQASKQARLIAMLRAAEGATVDEIAAAFSWQKHTVRGAIAGALKKRLGLSVASERIVGRGRVYRIAD